MSTCAAHKSVDRSAFRADTPLCKSYMAPAEQVTLATADRTTAVIVAGSIISFVRFFPDPPPAEMKGFGNAPASREYRA
jgi:hypothetical protein